MAEIKIKGDKFVVGGKEYKGTATSSAGTAGEIRVKGGRQTGNSATPTFEYVPHGGNRFYSLKTKMISDAASSGSSGLWETSLSTDGNNIVLERKTWGSSTSNYRLRKFEISVQLPLKDASQAWYDWGYNTNALYGVVKRFYGPSDPSLERVVVGMRLGVKPRVSKTVFVRVTAPNGSYWEHGRWGTGPWSTPGTYKNWGFRNVGELVPEGQPVLFRIKSGQSASARGRTIWEFLTGEGHCDFQVYLYYIDLPVGESP